MICRVSTSLRRLTCYPTTKPHQAQLESTLIKLTNADTQIEDLKMQLDDALGAEEMVVQLTERTLTLGEVTAILTTYDSLFISYAENRGNAGYDRRLGSSEGT
jgi:hypothetical protein